MYRFGSGYAGLGIIIDTLFVTAGYVAMLYYLINPRVIAAWNGISTDELVPAESKSPPEILLIALLLLFFAGTSILSTSLQFFALLRGNDVSSLPGEYIVLLVIPIALGVITLIAGIGLWRNLRWAYPLAVLVLVLSIVWPSVLAIISYVRVMHQPDIDGLFPQRSITISNLLQVLPSLLYGGTMIYFLFTSRRQKQPPAPFTTEPAPETPAE